MNKNENSLSFFKQYWSGASKNQKLKYKHITYLVLDIEKEKKDLKEKIKEENKKKIMAVGDDIEKISQEVLMNKEKNKLQEMVSLKTTTQNKIL